MNRVFLHLSLCCAVCAVFAALPVSEAGAGVQTLTFDDLPGDGSAVPNGYGGFDWQNFYVLNGTQYPGTGYDNGLVSGQNVAYNAYGDPASVVVSSSNVFTFDSVYLTAAWNNGLNITVDGYLNGNLADTETVTVDTTGPTLLVATRLPHVVIP